MPLDNEEAGSSRRESKRLPPNPRRRKIPPEQRKRVLRACNACNIRRIKCSGTQPCLQCSVKAKACEYPAEKRKVTVAEGIYTELQDRCSLLQRCLEDAVPSEEKRRALFSKWAKTSGDTVSSPATVGYDDEEEGENAWDGRILQDPDGFIRYMGESSGAAFMDRLREFVSKVLPLLSGVEVTPSMEDMFTSLLGRYHTHDSRLLALPDVDLFYLPSPSDIAKLLAVFRLYTQIGAGSSSGGIYYWGNLWDLEHNARRCQQSAESGNDSHMLAYLNIVMALACQYDPSLSPTWEAHPGLTYFARAKHLLINPMEDANPTNMSILSLMAQYLLGIYRRDAAYLYVGLAGRTAIIYGLHKGWTIEGQGSAGEEIKRQFWNTYILDRSLSCLMGRPPMIPEEGVDVDMPTDYPRSNLPPAAGLRAHIELSKIMDEIVNRVYGTDNSVRVASDILPRVHAAMQKLSSWIAALPPSLQLHEEMNPERECLLLQMMYNQLRVLCTRPLLFITAKQAVAAKYIPSAKNRPPTSYYMQVKACVEAARRNSQLCRLLSESNQAATHCTLDYHYAFTAAIVLQLARLVPDTYDAGDSDLVQYLSEYLCTIGDKGNESARDCASMVIELGAVVSRLISNGRVLRLGNEALSQAGIGDAVGGAPERMGYMQGQDVLLNSGDNLPVLDSVLGLGPLQENEPAMYQELVSWFKDAIF